MLTVRRQTTYNKFPPEPKHTDGCQCVRSQIRAELVLGLGLVSAEFFLGLFSLFHFIFCLQDAENFS